MECKKTPIRLSEKEFELYIDKCIGKIYACLKIYEKDLNHDSLVIYIKRLILEFVGFDDLIESNKLMSIISVLNGIVINIEYINHKEMKSAIFYCIDVLKKGVK